MRYMVLVIQFMIILCFCNAGYAENQQALDLLNFKTENITQSCEITVDVLDSHFPPEENKVIVRIIMETDNIEKPYYLNIRNINSDFPQEERTGFHVNRNRVKEDNIEFEISNPIPDGKYYVHAEIKDAFGNTMVSDSEPYVINYEKSSDHAPLDIHVGDNVIFGSYPKTDESIKWTVLEIRTNYALLVCQDLVELDLLEHAVWNERNHIRKWLNNSFYSQAFTDEEKEAIKEVPVRTYSHIRPRSILEGPGQSDRRADESRDKIFILSIDEIDDYEDALKEHMICQLHGNGDKSYSWWVRGSYNGKPYVINEKGMFEYEIHTFVINGIRPALWVKYNMDVFKNSQSEN